VAERDFSGIIRIILRQKWKSVTSGVFANPVKISETEYKHRKRSYANFSYSSKDNGAKTGMTCKLSDCSTYLFIAYCTLLACAIAVSDYTFCGLIPMGSFVFWRRKSK
jgi:hypothetical protein